MEKRSAKGGADVTKKKTVLFILMAILLCFVLSSCGRVTSVRQSIKKEASAHKSDKKTEEQAEQAGIAVNHGNELTIGFSQVGEESDWRLAANKSVTNAFSTKYGYNLIYDNAQQKQENQIKAVREFIDQNVDYIIIDPITEYGWDNTLEEAQEAGIPVIIVDRNVSVSDRSLYTAWIGSDFRMEGDRACAWLKTFLDEKNIKGRVNIAHIQGTYDSSAQLGRTAALEEACRKNSNWKIISSKSGEFTQAKGKEVMEQMLRTYGDSINVVYCENDNEAFGAIEAIEAAGKTAGKNIRGGEIMVISFDATRSGLLKTLDGKIALNVECNPDYGPKLTQIVMDLNNGKVVPHDQYIEETMFSAHKSITEVRIESLTQSVTLLTEELIDGRMY
ncbi:MAG: ABC transporter substrate-binding protein [Lachnospiraceae bacterium]|nr:ABC transporter substrate-binding protein [Lachnospiraceae bacterium]